MAVTIASGKAFTSFPKSPNQNTNLAGIATAKADIIIALNAQAGAVVQAVPLVFDVDTGVSAEGREAIVISCALRTLAASRHKAPEARDEAVKYRDWLASRMTPAQIAEAQKLA